MARFQKSSRSWATIDRPSPYQPRQGCRQAVRRPRSPTPPPVLESGSQKKRLARSQPLGAGRGRQGSAGGGGVYGSGVAAKRSVAISSDDAPSIIAWWARV